MGGREGEQEKGRERARDEERETKRRNRVSEWAWNANEVATTPLIVSVGAK